ncbi:MAG: hypothetical protein ACE3L7_01530 [Candidatus Pristimantibacillus sp.]
MSTVINSNPINPKEVIEEEISHEVIITLREHSLPTVEEFQNGVKLSEGSYTHESIVDAFLRSEVSEGFATPILPYGTIHYAEYSNGKCYCFIEIPPHQRKAFYHEAVIEDVPIPRLIFGFVLVKGENKYALYEVLVGALEQHTQTSEDAEVCFYPYTNVDNRFSVCWGTTQLPSIERVSQLRSMSELFFNSPNSDCYYDSANVSQLPYRDLVESLRGKEFPDTYLKKTGLKLSEWITQVTPIH